MNLPYYGFGDQQPPDGASAQDIFDADSALVHGPQSFLIQNALVHSQYGLVTVDNFGVRELTAHFPWFRFPEFKMIDSDADRAFELPVAEPSATISAAYAMQAGIHNNYFHWTILSLARLNSSLLEAWADEVHARPILLLSMFQNEVQRHGAAILSGHYRVPFLNLSNDGCIGIEHLVYPVHLRSGGVRIHPIIREPMAVLKDELYDTRGSYPAKIYVTRRDTVNRPLLNEPEIENFLTDRGFKVMSLAGLTLPEQVNIFAHARKVISAHGAGLANLVFSEPGTSVLELHSPTYISWVYRRLAGVYGLRYGFLFGEAGPPAPGWVHSQPFSLALSRLKDVIDGTDF